MSGTRLPRLGGHGIPPGGAPAESLWISLRYFNLYRIAVAGLFLGVVLVYDDVVHLGSQSMSLFRACAVTYLVLGIVFDAVLRNLRDRFQVQLSFHVFTDVAALTILMYSSGGLRSGLGVMLLISLVGAALIAPRRLNYLYASLAAIALLLEQGYQVLVHDAPTENFLQPGLLSIGCFSVASVTGWLAQRVAANESLARQRERELETQMRVNELVIEDMHDGVLVVDGEGRTLQHNPQARRLLGIDVARGQELERLIPGFGRHWEAWRVGERAPIQINADFEVRGRDLRLRLLETGTEEDLSVLFIEDMTRSREEAQQLKLASLGRLTANIAHEIRNPLSAISHASELLAETRGDRDRERLCRIIHDNTLRLERLVHDVLQLNRRDRLAAERLHLNAWLRSFVEEFVANEGIPPERFVLEAVREVHVEFDREHLRQILWNVLRNAVRYARQEPRSVRIVLGSFADQVELSVIDNGPGVPAANQGQLFEPFFTTDSKGTGLGLYLARELCTANRAVLEYVNDGAGAHFRLLLRASLVK